MKLSMLVYVAIFDVAAAQGLGNGRQLMESCSLSCRIFDYEDGTEFIEPFCVLQGADRNPNKGGRNNVRITGGNGVAASKNLINAAAAGDSDFFANAYIDEESGDLVVADDADVEINSGGRGHINDNHHLPGTRQLRRLALVTIPPQSVPVTYTTLVVRVNAATLENPIDEAELADNFFLDTVNLQSQVAACSNGLVNFIPADLAGVVNDGVYTLTLDSSTDIETEDTRHVEEQVLESLKDTFLGPSFVWNFNQQRAAEGYFDKIVIIMPNKPFVGSVEGAAAYAIPNSWLSVFRHDYSHSVSVQMHELGHNLGLAHSGDSGTDVYGDHSGVLGGYFSPDDHTMCYNGAKTYQLGWRPSLDCDAGTDFSGSLTSFVDYDDESAEQQVCIIKVITAELFYFIHYNRQVGSNSQTMEYGNKVMITTTGTSGEYLDLKSWVVSALDSDGSFDVQNGGGPDIDMTISVGNISGGTAEVSVLFTGQPTTCVAWHDDCNANNLPPCCPGLTCHWKKLRCQ